MRHCEGIENEKRSYVRDVNTGVGIRVGSRERDRWRGLAISTSTNHDLGTRRIELCSTHGHAQMKRDDLDQRSESKVTNVLR